MLTLTTPWVLALLPLPLLAWWLVPAAESRSQAALTVPSPLDFEAAGWRQTSQRRPWLLVMAILAWCLLVLAAARPEHLGEPLSLPVSGRDLLLAVDLSGSMEERDFRLQNNWVDRLTATQAVATEFIDRRVGDRIGLILFGRQAYLQTPLTFDRDTVKVLLNEATIGLAGKETAIGDAIGLAIKTVEGTLDEKAQRVLILLTDGANTAGQVDPTRAARIAADRGLKIYTIGVGADEMVERSLFGRRRRNPSADLDEVTLGRIAELTGGVYFRARDTSELERIYGLLDDYEPVAQDEEGFRPQRALFMWPLGVALILSGVLLLRYSGVFEHRNESDD